MIPGPCASRGGLPLPHVTARAPCLPGQGHVGWGVAVPARPGGAAGGAEAGGAGSRLPRPVEGAGGRGRSLGAEAGPVVVPGGGLCASPRGGSLAAGFCLSEPCSVCLLALKRCGPSQGQVVAPPVPSVMRLHEKEELGRRESPAQAAPGGHGGSAPGEVREGEDPPLG